MRAFALMLFAAEVYASAGAQTLVLSPEVTSAPVHSLINVTATLQGAAGPGGVTFLDGEAPIVSLALSRRNTAVLSIASLSAGLHNISAVYVRGKSSSRIASDPLLLTVTASHVPLSAASTTGTVYAGGAARIDIAGLPDDAGGSVVLSEGGSPLATMNVNGRMMRRYEVFGESANESTPNHAAVLASRLGLALTDYSAANASACDVLPLQILKNGAGPSQSVTPLYTLVASKDESDFGACEAASLAWLGIPREYKVLPGDARAAIVSGVWSSPSANVYNTLTNSAGAGSVRFTITSSGGPVYLWYLVGDYLDGSFRLTLDGIPSSEVYTSHAATPVRSKLNPDGVGFALVRLPVDPGRHTLDVEVVSGTVGVLGIATPPASGSASVHPTVLVAGDSQAMREDVDVLRGDGLDLRFVRAQPGTSSQFELASTFEEAVGDVGLVSLHADAVGSSSALVSLSQPGKHTIDVSYSGDSTYATAARSITLDVLPRSQTTTSLSTNATSFFAGAAIQLTASVLPASATGMMSLWDGTQYLATAPVVAGGAAFSLSSLAVGIHSLTAVYSGDATNADSQNPPLAIEITPASTRLVMAQVAASALYGVPMSLAASVTPASATGNITFTDTFVRAGQASSSIQALGHASLIGGAAALDVALLPPGTHTFTAAYTGDSNNLSATSAPVSTIIRTIPTSTVLGPAADVMFGTSQILTATVAPSSATGVVMFRDTLSGLLGSAPLLNGSVSMTLPLLPPGAHTLTATYGGDAVHDASTSAAETVQIARIPSTTTLAPLPATSTAGVGVRITASVMPGSATGTVLFRDRSAGSLGQVTLAAGSATLTLGALPVGSYEVTAVYSGDTDTAASASAAVSMQVVLAPTTTTLASISRSSPFSNPVTLTASVAPMPAAGSVTFVDNGHAVGSAEILNGVATLTLYSLPVGAHALQASFAANSIDAASSSSPVAIDVVPATTSTTLSLAQASVPAGGPVIFNVRVSNPYSAVPTGLVTIRSGGEILASGTLANGVPGIAYATITAPAPALGTFPVTAFYSGDAGELPSDSSATSISYSVIARPTIGTLTLSATQVPPLTPVTVAADFASAGQIPSGGATFLSGSHVIATVQLDGYGHASVILPPQAIGTYAISATYIPAGIFAASVAPAQTLTVTRPLVATLSPSTLNVVRGTGGTASLILTPLSGFQGTVSMDCATPGPYLKCAVDSSPALASSPAAATVHIAVAKNMLVARATAPSLGRLAATFAMLLPLFLIRSSTRRLGRTLVSALILGSLTGCAEGGNFGEIFPGVQIVHIQVTAAGTTSVVDLSVNIQ